MKNTLFIGKVYHHFVEIPSTNDYALELTAKSRPPEGTVVRADSQTAGRGQFGSRWQAEPGLNLTLSVILYPHWLAAGKQFYLGMAVALAVRDTLAACGFPDARIKWPNDVLIGGRKTAGILIQNSLKGAWIGTSVVGIGLNVNQNQFPQTLPHATSMAMSAQRTFDLENVENTLLGSLEKRYLRLKNDKCSELADEYHQHLYLHSQWGMFEQPDGSRFPAFVKGVQPGTGAIILLLENGGECQYNTKEIIFVH